MALVLVVDDELPVLDIVSRVLTARGHRPVLAASPQVALESVNVLKPDLAVVDLRLGGVIDGLALFQLLRLRAPELPGIMLTAFGTFQSALECGRAGFAMYLGKPFDLNELIDAVESVLASGFRVPQRSVHPVQAQPTSFDGIVGCSPVMRDLFERIVKAGTVDQPVLISGETGTGKELIARSIHQRSPRAQGPFVDVNCAAIPGALSEFFGHERGAYTDAKEAMVGKFEQAHRGTLFLDEIGELPRDLQAKLLRVLERGEVTRLGGRRSIAVDVRILAATNADLAIEVERGTFRRDLYWRLNGIPLAVPPLRERGEDLLLLVDHFLPQQIANFDASVTGLSEDAMRELTKRHWAGNVRELQHVLRCAVLACKNSLIGVADLPPDAQRNPGVNPALSVPTDVRLAEAVDRARSQLERQMIENALGQHRTAGEAAKALGIDPKTLYEKRLRYKL